MATRQWAPPGGQATFTDGTGTERQRSDEEDVKPRGTGRLLVPMPLYSVPETVRWCCTSILSSLPDRPQPRIAEFAVFGQNEAAPRFSLADH